jgi:twitching motility protein PilT
MDLHYLLKQMVAKKASDIHFKVGSPPFVRIDGELQPLTSDKLTPADMEEVVEKIMSEGQKKRFKLKKEVDFAYSLPGIGRFRTNVFKQRGYIGVVLRRVTAEPPTVSELGLPPVVEKLASEPRGLILVTGTAGSGKTTTLAAMINHINKTRRCHIVTIEDPIEVLHPDKLGIINQREIGIDTDSYADALRHVVRQDPDVIMIGEMRDDETVRAALTAAEIGNLVLSSLHTIDATETINRIIDFFPPYQQKQIRLQLSSTLKGIISLRLLPRIGGGRVPAVEIMVTTAFIRECIIKPEDTDKIIEAIEQGDYYGMQSFDQSLLKLYAEGQITLEHAVSMSSNAHDFMLRIKQAGLPVS